MRPSTAQAVFVSISLVSIPVGAWPVYAWWRVSKLMDAGASRIRFDSGDGYFLLMSVFWVLAVLQYAGLHGAMAWVKRHGPVLLLAWLVACLVLANRLPVWLDQRLTQAGYQRCPVEQPAGRRSPGERLVYQRPVCSGNAGHGDNT